MMRGIFIIRRLLRDHEVIRLRDTEGISQSEHESAHAGSFIKNPPSSGYGGFLKIPSEIGNPPISEGIRSSTPNLRIGNRRSVNYNINGSLISIH